MLCSFQTLILEKDDSREACLPGRRQALQLSSPHTQICASSGQQDFYFHPFVISSVHNYEWEKLRRGRGGVKLQNILQKALPFYFKVLITTDDLHLQEMASVPRRDAPSFL